MLVTLSFWMLTLAAAMGSALSLWHLRTAEGMQRPPAWLGWAHGIIGAIGFVALLLTLQGPVRGAAYGAGSFGRMAAWAFALALTTGVVILLRRRRGPVVTMVVHSGIAITGWMLLMTWNALG